MSSNQFRAVLGLLVLLSSASPGEAQIGKANQLLLNRGLQVQGLVTKDDVFHLNTYTNANYNSIIWLWESNPSLMGAAPGFPWARWVGTETNMPPQGAESGYESQIVTLQLGDEWGLNDPGLRDRAVNWFNAIRTNWTNTILYMNNYGGQVSEANLADFISRAQPDMICFDTYPWKSTYDANQPNHVGVPIAGPPTGWYSQCRIYRDIARGYNIPFGTYMQTFHAVEEYGNFNVYRDPSPSELRLNHSAALAFNAKVLIDFTYNTGASSLFTSPGGDSNPKPLFADKTEANLCARNLGKALVRLKPIDEATSQWTTSVVFVRGKDANGALNPIPINFFAGPSGTNPNTDWVADRNDPWLRGWVVTNTGTKNNGQPGDVIIAWFKLLDESFDGPSFTNEVYFMVVNGLTDTNGTAADCAQEIKLNFLNTFSAVELLDPLTGQAQAQVLPIVSTRRQLILNLNGGDAALFKISDGAPFVGVPVVGPPVITSQPVGLTNALGTTATFSALATGVAPLQYQWRFNGTNIPGATTNSYARANVQYVDMGEYRLVVTNTVGSITSAPAVLTVVSNLLFLYEPFDYPNIGAPVSSNTPANWAYGGTGANDLNVASGSLSYSGFAQSVGNSVTNGGVGLGVRRLFNTIASSGAIYFSALFRINNLGFGTWNGAASQAGALTATDSSSFRLAVMVKSNSPAGYVIGVQKGGSGATTTFDTTEHSANETVLLVGKYDFDASPNAVSLWVNPDPSTFGVGSPPSGFISANSGVDGFMIDRFNLRQNTATSVPAAMQWDELRVGRLWSDVTPAAAPGPINISSFSALTDGSFQLSYSNASGPNGSIHASTNLTSWAAIGVATQVMPGVFQFIDSAASNYPKRFYQLRPP